MHDTDTPTPPAVNTPSLNTALNTQWNPAQYERFAAERQRPADDLVAALPAGLTPRRVVDLGCGTGRLARQLAARWPGATVLGIDSSAEMLAKAAAAPTPSTLLWQQADIARWQPAPDAPVDVLVSNAALHWLPDHATLLPRLLGALVPGGWLAVQMPRNFTRPSHTELHAIAADPRWAARIGSLYRDAPVATPHDYYDWLAPQADSLSIWQSEYLHPLRGDNPGDNPVLEWTKGTALLPVRAHLSAAELADFTAAYAARLTAAYPPRADGVTLFPFRRLFIVAQRRKSG